MSYYGQFIHRQAELTQATMEQARKALLAEGEAEALYRQELEDQIIDLQKSETVLKKQLVKSGTWTPAEKLKWLKAEQSIRSQGDQRRKERADLTFKINERATFDDSVLGRLAEDFSGSIVGGANADEVVRNVIAQAEDPRMGTAGRLSSLAKKAQQDGDASSVDYAMKLADFLEEQIVKLGGPEISEKHRNQLKAAAARVAGTPTRSIADVSPQSKQRYLDQETKELTGLLSNSSPLLLKKFEELKASAADPREIARVQRAIEIKMETSGAQRAEIEAQLEALGRPMEVTEEAVRARTQEMMEPYEGMTPFPIAAALGERFKKRMQERRGEKAVADFDDLSDDQQIIFQNAIKAEQWRTDLGGRLPSEDQMNTIEWKRARDIMRLVESGELPKTAMIRTALQFAEKDLGRGAPPTDVRRQRDEIIERVMMLRANTTAMGKANVKPPPPRERPKPVVEPAVAPAAAPAGTGRGATTPASTTPSLPDDLVASAQRRKVFGEPPSVPLVEHGPEEAPTGSAVANILDPALATSSTEPQVSLYTPEEMGASPAPTPVRTATAVTAQPQEPRGSTPASWGGVSPTREETAARAQQSEERKAQEASAVRERRAWAEAAKIFSASQTPQDIPGLSTDPSVLAQLAEAARMAGLPLPGWYAALQAQDFFATPVASNP